MATELLRNGVQVRVKDDAKFTLYRGKVGTITQVYRDMEGQPRFMVAFEDGKGSVYHAEELELLEEANDGK